MGAGSPGEGSLPGQAPRGGSPGSGAGSPGGESRGSGRFGAWQGSQFGGAGSVDASSEARRLAVCPVSCWRLDRDVGACCLARQAARKKCYCLAKPVFGVAFVRPGEGRSHKIRRDLRLWLARQQRRRRRRRRAPQRQRRRSREHRRRRNSQACLLPAASREHRRRKRSHACLPVAALSLPVAALSLPVAALSLPVAARRSLRMIDVSSGAIVEKSRLGTDVIVNRHRQRSSLGYG